MRAGRGPGLRATDPPYPRCVASARRRAFPLRPGTTFADFFADACLTPHASQITGVVCGVRVEDVDDPLMQKIRYLDKLVDELARGKAIEKVLRA
ncbi:MAG: DUF2200 family protein [Aeromicrobium sp.]